MIFYNEKKVLERYEKDGKKYVISVSTNRFKDLFEDFDRSSSFLKRDLDYDFAEYLYESAEDLENREFYIRLVFHKEMESPDKEKKINQGIDNYFKYENHKLEKLNRNIAKKIVIHFLLAFLCLFTSFFFSQYLQNRSFTSVLFGESLMIASWVFMWPIFSDFIYELLANRRVEKIHQKLIDAKICFRYLNLL